MTTYAIGDVQGCFAELEKLLEKIEFNQDKDTLWFTGDLVNRGPRSLDTLRFIKALGDKHTTVLGNHDLHLLALAYGTPTQYQADGLEDILQAPDKEELLGWLCHRPLLYYDKATQFVLVHAGLAPSWSLSKACSLAQEVEAVLKDESKAFFLSHLHGNQPNHWDDNLSGVNRLRSIINYLTRMRFCYADGRLDFTHKGEIAERTNELIPWFDVPNRVNAKEKIIFGHWAALNGKTHSPHVYALDTGCVWGNCLTAMRIEDGQRISVKCG